MRDIAVGLDVGTTKICAMVAKRDGAGIEISALGFSPSTGLRKGIVVDTEKTAEAIRRSLAEAGDNSGVDIKSVYVGIAGGHIKGFDGYSAVRIGNRKVSEADVQRLMDAARAVYVPVDREVLHVIPAGFKLDGCKGIMNPVGMRGDRLEAKVHIVTGAVASVQGLIRCCELAGAEVADIVPESLASSESVLSEEEKDKGVVVVDIGGGTTDIAAYRNGVPRHTAVLSLGGNHITNDIAVGLGITADEAERLKNSFGSALRDHADKEAEINVDGHGKIPCRYLAEIIHFRCEEMLHLVKREMRFLSEFVTGSPSDAFFSGLVLTGGTSLLKGIDVLAEQIMGLPVRIGMPADMGGPLNLKSPVFATGTGLIRYGLRQSPGRECPQTQDAPESINILERMKYWGRDFLIKNNLNKRRVLCLRSKM